MTNGDGDERFEFGIDVLVSGLAAVSENYRCWRPSTRPSAGPRIHGPGGVRR